MGWGQCSIKEFAHFSFGDQLIIVIPSDSRKKDSRYAMTQRQLFCKRVVQTIGALLGHRNNAQQHVSNHHVIERNQKDYIELQCSFEKYAYRDEYLQDILPISEVSRHLRQHEGIYLALLNYSVMATTTISNIIHPRWTELPFVQVWTTFYHGGHRPPFIIRNDSGTPNYTQEIVSHYNNYMDDNHRLRELLLAIERDKYDAISKANKSLEQNYSMHRSASESVFQEFPSAQLKDVMEDHRMPEFIKYADHCYYDAWVQHYSTFCANAPLLSIEQMHHF
jgi:hypothetical protein